MAGYYIPRSDEAFGAWADNFEAYAAAHTQQLGITAQQASGVSQAVANFKAKMAAHFNIQQAVKSAKHAKDDSRVEAESAIRLLVRQLQASGNVDDSQRRSLGITVPDRIRTAASAQLSNRPLGIVETAGRLAHRIRFFDEATPTSRARPAGVLGCEIWVKVLGSGEPAPLDPRDMGFAALDTASPHMVEYEGSQGGKTAHYMLRWVKGNGTKGPWSETVSATITA